MKKFIPREVHKIIIPVFFIALGLIFLYELVLIDIPSSKTAYRLGIIFSKVDYSIIAASLFYFLSVYLPVYLPKQDRTLKIISVIYTNTANIDYHISCLQSDLNLSQGDYLKQDIFIKKLNAINSDMPINEYVNWHEYLYFMKHRILEIIRSTTTYNEYISTDLLHELLLIENKLLSPIVFEGYKKLQPTSLSYAQISIQELFVHQKILQDLRELEFTKYDKKFEILGKEYREKNFNNMK